MKSDTKSKLDSLESKALIKVEKLFNALKKDSVLKVTKKLDSLGFLNSNEPSSSCNPQMDMNDGTYHSRMEVIAEAFDDENENQIKSGNFFKPTSSYNNRKTIVNEEIKYRKEATDESQLSKTNKSKSIKTGDKIDENELARQAFVNCYKKEFERRRDNYLEQKAKKEEIFREIEQLKTSKRLIENKLNKSKKSSATTLFPMKIEVSINRATIKQRKEVIPNNADVSYLGLFFKVDNGKEYYDSVMTNSLEEPQWTDVFQLTMMNEAEIIFFQLMLNDKNTNSIRVIDTFDLRGGEIISGLDAHKQYKDTIVTSSGNEYFVFIKKKGDELTKLKLIEKKIESKNTVYTRLNQILVIAKESMENLINKNGMDLIKEWGFMSKKGKNNDSKNINSKELCQEENKVTPGVIKQKLKQAANIPRVSKTATFKPEESKSFSKTMISNISKLKEGISNNESEEVKNIQKSPKGVSSNYTKHRIEVYQTPDDKRKRKDLACSVDVEKHSELTSETIRKSELKRNRLSLSNSLIGFSINEVARTHRVKSEFNMSLTSKINSGQLFSTMNAKMKIGGMLNENLLTDQNNDDDNLSAHALSFSSMLHSIRGKTDINL